LIKKKGYKSVEKWTKKKKIFDLQYLLIPVYLSAHWCMMIVDTVSRKISYYDSFRGTSEKFYEVIVDFLQEEWRKVYGNEDFLPYTEDRVLVHKYIHFRLLLSYLRTGQNNIVVTTVESLPLRLPCIVFVDCPSTLIKVICHTLGRK